MTSSTKLSVYGIPSDATEDSIRQAMKPYGSLSSIRIGYNRDTGKPIGIAWIEFHSQESCKRALKDGYAKVRLTSVKMYPCKK